jgi:hypothetical protein
MKNERGMISWYEIFTNSNAVDATKEVPKE